LIQEDLQSPETPKSAIGFIVQALKLRKELKLNGFTVMSCDNVPNNSRVAQQVVLDYANLLDPELEAWIKENTSFPCTMVDRIVPAITEESFAELKDRLSIDDPCGIVCESFSQWVIEDDFIEGRPEWDVAGATFVDDVRPFEDMKLRLLNGSHSFLAYLGYLSGYKYIYQTMQDDAFKKATLALMLDEQAMTLSMPKGIDITEYSKSLIDRFSNANIKHETGQIAADGSQKLPQRFCESLRFLLDQERMPIWILLGIAGWMLYVSEEDEQGEKIIVKDPLLDQIREAYKNSQTTKDLVFSLLGIKAIFGEDLIQHKVFVDSLIDKLEQLRAIGAKSTVFENQ